MNMITQIKKTVMQTRNKLTHGMQMIGYEG